MHFIGLSIGVLPIEDRWVSLRCNFVERAKKLLSGKKNGLASHKILFQRSALN